MSKKNYKYHNNNKQKNFSNSHKANTPLTEGELYQTLDFASKAYGMTGYGVYTPYLTNQRLSEIASSALDISQDTIKDAIKNITTSQKELIGYSTFIQFSDAIAKRTLGYMGNLPAFDFTYYCNNLKSKEDLQSEEYKNAINILKDLFTKFDVKGEFAHITRRMLENDAFYAMFRIDGNRYTFQELPYDYCLITGKSPEWGYLFDFDMTWFYRQGLSLKMYPKAMQKLYLNVMEAKNANNYNPSNKLNARTGTWALWTQTSPLPNEGAFACFKWNSDTYATIPFLTTLFLDSKYRPVVRALQENQYIIASQKLLVGLLPFLKDQKSGQVKDSVAIGPDLLEKYLGVLQKGIQEILVKAVPFSDVKEVTYDMPSNSIYNEYMTNEASNTGVTSRIIYSSDRQSALETEYSVNTDEIIATSIYPQCSIWLTSFVNWLLETNGNKYRFTFTFEGTKFTRNRRERLDVSLKLADKGIVLTQKIAAAIGMTPFEFEEQLKMGFYSDFRENLYLLLNSNTKDYGENGDIGRPNKDIADVSESRERSDDYMGGV